MSRFALLMLQMTASIAPAPSDERLLHPVPSSHCKDSTTEIVVCARDQDQYRLPRSGPQAETGGLPKAEWRVFGNARMNVHVEERGSGSPAAMVTLTVPF